MKTPIHTEDAPKAIGPYSQGIRSGRFVYTSGQLPMTPDGRLETDDIRVAVRMSMDNVRAILEAGGAGIEDVVKTTIFLTDLSDFSAANEAYAAYFPGEPPARSCVQVAALPRGAAVEIEAVAVVG